jgi:hypothetical protein
LKTPFDYAYVRDLNYKIQGLAFGARGRGLNQASSDILGKASGQIHGRTFGRALNEGGQQLLRKPGNRGNHAHGGNSDT